MTGFLELCEALGGPLGKLIVILMAFGLIWMMWRVDRRRENARKKFWEQVDRESKAFWEQADREREAHEKRADRIRAEFKAEMKDEREAHEKRADRDSEQNVRDHVRLTDAIAALQGDVKVLLDRSDRSSGGEAGGVQRGNHLEVVRQATPDQCEDEVETSSEEPVAALPSASAANEVAD